MFDFSVYVEVLHTNAGLLGLAAPLGQADFYPNFLKTQPGCGLDYCSRKASNDRLLIFLFQALI